MVGISDTYTLAIALDTTGAQKGARDFNAAANRTTGEIEKLAKASNKTRDNFTQLAGSFTGAFSQKILLQIAGVTTVMGLLTTAAGLVANEIIELAIALHDKLAPAWKEQQKAQEEWIDRQNAMTDAHKKFIAEISKDDLRLGVPGTSYQSFSSTGLNDKRRDELSEFIRKANEALNQTVSNFGGRTALAREQQAGLFYEVDDLLKSLRGAQELEDKRLATEKGITAEVQKQKDAFRFLNQGTQVSQGIGRFALQGAAQFKPIIEDVGTVIGYKNQDSAAAKQQSAQVLATGIISGFQNAAQLIARAIPQGFGGGSGSNNGAISGDPYAAASSAAFGAEVEQEKIRRIEEKNRKLYEEMHKFDATARQMGDSVGNAFESFIMGAQSAQEAVRNLGLQIIQSLLNKAVTQPISDFFTGLILKGLGGAAGGATSGTGGGLDLPDGNVQGIQAGGGTGGGFRYSVRQRRDSLAWNFS